jgi:hypothetical protein
MGYVNHVFLLWWQDIGKDYGYESQAK